MSPTTWMMYYMGRLPKVIMTVVLVALGLAGSVYFLAGQGLDKAEKWVTIVGAFVSVGIGLAGLAIGWATWRQSQFASEPSQVGVTAEPVSADGLGSVAVGGDIGAEVETDVSLADSAVTPPPSARTGVTASGAGAVAVGGSSTGPIRTRVTGPGRERKRS
jgi:hypothetical protein